MEEVILLGTRLAIKIICRITMMKDKSVSMQNRYIPVFTPIYPSVTEET